MIEAGHEKEVVWLTGPKPVTFAALVETISDSTGREIKVENVSVDVYVRESAEHDEGSKSERWFQKRILWYDGVAKGRGKAVDL